jgi:hypothetical protein
VNTDVSILRGGWSLQDADITNSRTLTNEMEINLNMLGTLMLNWIAGHVYDTDIITIDQCGTAEEQKDDGLPGEPVGGGVLQTVCRWNQQEVVAGVFGCFLGCYGWGLRCL